MSELTPNLGLFKYNPETDGKETFSITTALNNNWDILDNVMSSTSSLGESGYMKFNNGLIINYGKASSSSEEITWTQPVPDGSETLGGSSFAVYGDSENSAAYQPYYAFNNSTNYWISGNAGYPHYLIFYNPSAIKVTNITIQACGSYDIQDWTVLGSNTNGNWTQLASGSNPSISSGDYYMSLSSNTTFYKYYKISATSHNRGSGNYIAANNIRITATVNTTKINTLTFPQAFTYNYAYSLAYFNGVFGDSYAKNLTLTGMTLQNNSNATAVYYIAVGY